MNATRLLWLRIAVFILCLLPFIRLFVLGYNDELGANPVEFVTRSTGIWTLVFVCLTLAVTPLRRLTGFTWLIRLRRMLGLYAFFYSAIHLATYVWFDQWFDWSAIVVDVIKRPFITAGFVGFLIMVPLMLTSNNFSMRRLGRRWGRLHKAVYIVGLAGIIHFWWHKAGKNDFFEPTIYAVIVLILLGLRYYWFRADKKKAALRAAGHRADKSGLSGKSGCSGQPELSGSASKPALTGHQ
ncbi:MAG: protein-methionine-sulfoxide reductase heme-binding subunit MsrQ [Burkholderiaceae bacterium]